MPNLRAALFASFACLLGLSVQAQTSDRPLVRLDDRLSGAGWDAVGRIDIGGSGFCTGALISDRLVLTAAHCLFDKQTHARHDDASLVFRAGKRNGFSAAEARVLRSVVYPGFTPTSNASHETVMNDLALLELVRPISARGVIPFAVNTDPKRGDTVGVVSYAKGRQDVPSLQEECQVLQSDGQGVVFMTCSVDHGASGSPVFSFADGRAQIVSVVSAMAVSNAGDYVGPVSLGVALGPKLEELRAALENGNRHFMKAPSDGRVGFSTRGSSRSEGGARFLRP